MQLPRGSATPRLPSAPAPVPNWCSNRLTVLGETDDVLRFCRRAARPGVRYALPSAAVRDPLDPGVTAAATVPTTPCPQLRWEPRPPATPLSLHALVPVPLRVRRQGYAAAGYGWQREHWGVKWDLYEDVIRRPVTGGVQYDFRTPWGPPAHWFVEVVRRFPSLLLTLEYHEGGMCFAGTLEGEGGVLRKDECLDDLASVDAFEEDLFGTLWFGEPVTGTDPLPNWRRARARRRPPCASPMQLRLDFGGQATA